jgi:hypothetical protein
MLHALSLDNAALLQVLVNLILIHTKHITQDLSCMLSIPWRRTQRQQLTAPPFTTAIASSSSSIGTLWAVLALIGHLPHTKRPWQAALLLLPLPLRLLLPHHQCLGWWLLKDSFHIIDATHRYSILS